MKDASVGAVGSDRPRKSGRKLLVATGLTFHELAPQLHRSNESSFWITPLVCELVHHCERGV